MNTQARTSKSPQPLTPATYTKVEEHLSSEGIFLMGDAQTQGFPIRYASPGFESVYGYTGQEISGEKCGDLIGGPLILSSPAILAEAASAGQCSPEEAGERVRFLVEKAGEACRVMMASPNDRVGVALLLNRKKSGELFVCECLVLCLQHPSLNWAYTVGFQRDVTREVSITSLFRACNASDYNRLLRNRSAALEERRAVLLGVGGESVVQYLHEKALSVFSLDVWRTLRAELLTATPGSHPPTPVSGQELSPAPVAQRSLPPPPQSGTSPLPLAQLPVPGSPVGEHLQLSQLSPGELSLRMPGGRAQVRGGNSGMLPRVDYAWEPVKQNNPAVAFLAEANLHSCVEPLLLNGYDDLETLMDMTLEDMYAIGIARGHASKLQRCLKSLKVLQLCAEPHAGPSKAPTLLQKLHGSPIHESGSAHPATRAV